MQFDRNGDGRVSQEEFAAGPDLPVDFDDLDTDADGFISREEARSRRQPTQPHGDAAEAERRSGGLAESVLGQSRV